MLRCSLLLVLVLAVIMPAWGVVVNPLSFTATMIPAPVGTDLHPTGLNSLDQICGYTTDQALIPGVDPDNAVFWSQSGGLVLLGHSRANSLNRYPTIVGDTIFGADLFPTSIATAWSKYGPAYPSNVSSAAYAVNNINQIAGFEGVKVGNTLVSKPVVWYGIKKTFPIVATGMGAAYGINDNNTVAGQFNGDAFVVRNGIPKDLGAGAGLGVDPNNNVVGYSFVLGVERPTLWTFANKKILLSSLGFTGRALAANGHNVVVGYSQDFSGTSVATMWFGSAPFDLNSLFINIPAGWTLTKAVGVNDKGTVLCEGEDMSGNVAAFLLSTR